MWCNLHYVSSRSPSQGSRGPPWATRDRKSAKNPGPDASSYTPQARPKAPGARRGPQGTEKRQKTRGPPSSSQGSRGPPWAPRHRKSAKDPGPVILSSLRSAQKTPGPASATSPNPIKFKRFGVGNRGLRAGFQPDSIRGSMAGRRADSEAFPTGVRPKSNRFIRFRAMGVTKPCNLYLKLNSSLISG